MTGTQIIPTERALALIGGEPSDANLRRYLHGIPGVDAVGLEQRAAAPRHPLDQDHVARRGRSTRSSSSST